MIPACRSNELNSFISRLLRRVQAADSYEHQAVPTVASAIANAVTGSIHFRFACSLGRRRTLWLDGEPSSFESVTTTVCHRRIATPIKHGGAHRLSA
jgi:hypothetical protein